MFSGLPKFFLVQSLFIKRACDLKRKARSLYYLTSIKGLNVNQILTCGKTRLYYPFWKKTNIAYWRTVPLRLIKPSRSPALEKLSITLVKRFAKLWRSPVLFSCLSIRLSVFVWSILLFCQIIRKYVLYLSFLYHLPYNSVCLSVYLSVYLWHPSSLVFLVIFRPSWMLQFCF